MKITLLLAEFAKADQQGEVTAVGMGWNSRPTPLPPFALVIFVEVGWDETNKPHVLTCDLVTEDGEPVELSGPLGDQPVHFEARVEAGRPPGAVHGTAFRAPLAINVGGPVPLPPGRYEWRAAINGFPQATAVAPFVATGRRQSRPPQPESPQEADQ